MVGAEGRKFSNLRWSRRQENAIPRRNSNKKMCKIKVSLTFLERVRVLRFFFSVATSKNADKHVVYEWMKFYENVILRKNMQQTLSELAANFFNFLCCVWREMIYAEYDFFLILREREITEQNGHRNPAIRIGTNCCIQSIKLWRGERIRKTWSSRINVLHLWKLFMPFMD